MRPGWVDLFLLLHARFRELKVRLLDIGERTEDIFLDHGHDIIKMRNDQCCHCLLILKQGLHFVDSVQPLGLALDIAGLVLVVVVALADEQLLLKALLEEILLRVLSVGTVGTCNLSSLRLGSSSR